MKTRGCARDVYRLCAARHNSRQQTALVTVSGVTDTVRSVTTDPAHTTAGERRAQAECEGLRELIGVFTHDLSNPLQSLTVLCELALAEAPEGSEERAHASQCLEATHRMNAVVLGVSKLARKDGPRHVRGILEHLGALFARRFDRYDVEFLFEIEEIGDVVAPVVVDLALSSLMLGAIARFTAERRRPGFSLSVRGYRPSPTLQPSRCALELLLEMQDGDGRQRLALPERHLGRVRDLVGGRSDVTFESADDIERLSFDAAEA